MPRIFNLPRGEIFNIINSSRFLKPAYNLKREVRGEKINGNTIRDNDFNISSFIFRG